MDKEKLRGERLVRKFYFFIGLFITGLFFYSACQASEVPIDKNFEGYTFVGYTREGLSDILWLQICSDEDSKCLCNKTPKSACLSKLSIELGKPVKFVKKTKTNLSVQLLKIMQKKIILVDLGKISADPNNEFKIDGKLEWKGHHFVVENNDWKSLPGTKVEYTKIEVKGENNFEYETVFSYFPSPKEEADRVLDSVQGYYLPDYGYIVLIPSYQSEQLLDGKAYGGAEGINWYWEGIIVLKTKSTIRASK